MLPGDPYHLGGDLAGGRRDHIYIYIYKISSRQVPLLSGGVRGSAKSIFFPNGKAMKLCLLEFFHFTVISFWLLFLFSLSPFF